MTLFMWTSKALSDTSPPHSGNWLTASRNTKRKYNQALYLTVITRHLIAAGELSGANT
jgi:hypothetical protein